MKFMKLALMAIPVLMLIVATSVAEGPEGKRGPRAKGNRGPSPERMKMILEKYDLDKDGKLSETERQQARADFAKKRGNGRPGAPGKGNRPSREELLKKFDANNDGKLDDDERAKAMKELRAGRGPRGKGPGKGNRPSREEIIKKFDTNGDGTLDETEKEAMKEAMRAKREAGGKKPGNKKEAN